MMDFTKVTDESGGDSSLDSSDFAIDKGIDGQDEEMLSPSQQEADSVDGSNGIMDEELTDAGGTGDDDDDSDENSDEDNEALIVAEINRLQEELSHDPMNYEKHVALISHIRSIGELGFLREAREKMNQHYPLSPQMWLEWIEDEIRIATTDEQRINIIPLFDRALAEYFDRTLWQKFIEYASELNETNLLTDDDYRKIFERALNHAGCCVNGTVFWQYYRLFEKNLLSAYPTLSDENAEQVNHYVKNIFNLYQRQFSIPLLKMEKDYEEFEEWLNEIHQKYGIDLKQQFHKELMDIKSDYEKSYETLQSLEEYEDNLNTSDAPHYNEYMEYIDFELKNANLVRAQSLFERAITDNCLRYELWLKYLKFCDEKFVVDELLFPIYERAIRNCNWITEIWIKYLHACERLGQNDDLEKTGQKMWSIVERALKNTFASIDDYKRLWLSYLNFIRRKASKTNAWQDEEQVKFIRDTFEGVINSVESTSNFEDCYDLYHYLAKIEAKYCKNIEKAHIIYQKLIKQSTTLKRNASFWLDYANLELLFGKEEEYRKLLLKGLNICSDDPSAIGKALLAFEQEDGESITQYEYSIAKYEIALKRFQEKRDKEIEKSIQVETTRPNRSLKRKAEPIETNVNKKGVEAKKKKVADAPPPPKEYYKTDESKREQTVFVSNLSYDINDDQIREEFLKFGQINEVRLARNFNGKSKGFGFVEFSDIVSARKALMHDRMLLHGRPVFISELDKRNKFSFSSSKEKNKLFVKNIPFDMTKDDILQKIFADYADSIVDIRLNTFRNGHSKGIAYIEMKNAEIAEKAVRERNDFKIGDRALFVAISDPSMSGNRVKPSLANPAPSSKVASTFMVPHSLMAKTHPSKVKMQLDPSTLKEPSSNIKSEIIEKPNLSNDQFRSMFLK